ncbi:hypothetical protein EPUL_000041 [Erysiphe pulchra]|uniref:Histone-lysine N-methyltransferase, H3 lysine-79 specific n=1 Tax=Erysiphe pulchra TaxID=225359 RepID=A0A2S4Q2E5_9PEZI|nr:hypothetical protein EPUL_000041 [Erysiphe pulchra]
MGSIFHNKSFQIKAAPAIIRTENVRNLSKSLSGVSKAASKSKSHEKKEETVKCSQYRSKRPSSDPQVSSTRNKSKSDLTKKTKLVHKRSYTQHQLLNSDTSDSENSVDFEISSYKRQKLTTHINRKRKLLSAEAFSECCFRNLNMIHAADIVPDEKCPKKRLDSIDKVEFELKYPSNSQPERYALVFGDDFNPAEEVINVIRTVLDFYFQENQTDHIKDPEVGILRKLTKAYNLFTKNPSNKDQLTEFKRQVEFYNSVINEKLLDGTFSKNLDLVHEIPLYMVECILQQVYTRAVSPKVEILKKYENGTDNVYGELLPSLISKMLWEAGLTSEGIFVDLGSGVGNVVLQASLEFGCESWGCEMMENAFTLAEAQKVEFDVRCRLWGLKTGCVYLERGDFLENQKIHAALQKADVILVNNQAFTPDLNQKLKDLFLDSKDGCRIISLKSFVPHGHQIPNRNLWDPANLFDVTERDYHSRSVSWTDAGGKYYIAKKDEKRLLNLTKHN